MTAAKSPKKIVVGGQPITTSDILKAAKDELEKEGYELEIKEYSDMYSRTQH
jgi:ABC-type metal ion transport system substrate-binding protein